MKQKSAYRSGFRCLRHFPILPGTSYMEGTPIACKLIAFTRTIFPIGVICGLLTCRSKSTWIIAAILYVRVKKHPENV